jgi:hypothetical protein
MLVIIHSDFRPYPGKERFKGQAVAYSLIKGVRFVGEGCMRFAFFNGPFIE